MRQAVIIFGLILVVSGVYAQLPTEQISVHERKYFFLGQELRSGDLVDMMMPFSEPSGYMCKATTNRNIGMLCQLTGIATFIYPFGQKLSSSAPADWYLLGVGAALIGVSIPFTCAYHKHVRQAVGLYNDIVTQKSVSVHELKIGPSTLGVSFSYSF